MSPVAAAHTNSQDIALSEARRLRMGRQLGRGSTATVYSAELASSFGVASPVAVKVFDAIATDDSDVVLDTLAHSVRLMARIQHPNVVRVHEFGLLSPSHPYAVMELLEGETLASFIRGHASARRRVALDIALFIAIEVAEALEAARTIKGDDGAPMNLAHGELASADVMLLSSGEVKLTDFGLSAAARGGSSVRSIRGLAERARALAPEVAQGRIGNNCSDVFSLGLLLREMLVGPRFPSDISNADALALARDGTIHGGMFEPLLPSDLAAILKRATEVDPDERYAHAGIMLYDLRRVALSMGVGDARFFLRSALRELKLENEIAESLPGDNEEEERFSDYGVDIDIDDDRPTCPRPTE